MTPLYLQGTALPKNEFDDLDAEARLVHVDALEDNLANVSADVLLNTGWLFFGKLGRFIANLGRACRQDGCQVADLDSALKAIAGMDVQTFEESWRSDWLQQLDSVQAGLDELMAAREAAVLAGDEATFLGTIDPGDPALVSAERHWLADLAEKEGAVRKAERKVKEAQDKVNDLTVDQGNLKVTAPRKGIVFYGTIAGDDPFGGDVLIFSGSSIRQPYSGPDW